MISQILEENSPLTERRMSSANHLFTLQTAAHVDHRVAIPILRVKYRAQFLLGVGWGGMSYWVYVTLSCHNWKRNDFRYSGVYLITSFVYRTNVYWSVIHGIKRKPHLSVVWNWYHFVAIANLHQSRPTDSADINTRLQLSDTSSIPPMHGGFLLILDTLHSSNATMQSERRCFSLWEVPNCTRILTTIKYWRIPIGNMRPKLSYLYYGDTRLIILTSNMVPHGVGCNIETKTR